VCSESLSSRVVTDDTQIGGRFSIFPTPRIPFLLGTLRITPLNYEVYIQSYLSILIRLK